jgi:hypothetical protein
MIRLTYSNKIGASKTGENPYRILGGGSAGGVPAQLRKNF